MKIELESLNIDAAEILRKAGLGQSDKAARYLANEVARLCDPYVPYQQGNLKRADISVEDGAGVVTYNQPYAHYQYYGEVMAGKAPKSYTGRPIDYGNDNGLRGKEWDKRMMADKGEQLISDFGNWVKGNLK